VGGICISKDVLKYFVIVSEMVGDDWFDVDWFCFGVFSFFNDLLL